MIGLLVVVGLLGLAVGSFLNVVIWRVPRGESVVRPASACPSCRTRIAAVDNIPVVSWLLLRGRCRTCKTPISARYPLVELATGVLFVLIALRFGFDLPGVAALPAYLYLAAIAVALALIDIETHRLPNAIVLPSYGVAIALFGAAALVLRDGEPLLRALAGGALLFGFYLVVALVHPPGMGLGDVKLAGVLGIFLAWSGWDALVVGAFAAFLIGGLFGLALLLTKRVGRRGGIPFGPWMLAGAMVGLFAGDRIAAGYLRLVGIN